LIATARGEYARARDVLERSLAMQQGLEDDLESVPSLFALGNLAIAMGQYSEADAHLDEASKRCRDEGAVAWLAYLSLEQVRLERCRGNRQEATHLAEECLPRFREMGESRAEAEITMELGLLAHDRGETKLAIDRLNLAAVILAELHDDLKLVRCLEGPIGPASSCTRFELAGQLAGASKAWRTAKRIVRAVAEQTTFEHDLVAVRSALGSDAFSRAWQAGMAMTLDQAVAAADRLTTNEVV
jgi:tetratricopeptide (TPR) repeat protein